MDPEHLSREAERLLKDDVLRSALSDMRIEALESLASVDCEEMIMVLRLQQRVAVVDEFLDRLRGYVHALGSEETPAPV